MNGNYTAVALRQQDRWTGARMTQGQVLLDHEWNLTLDAQARAAQDAARDVIGPAGVVEGSGAFLVSAAPAPARDLLVAAGTMWVDGLEVHSPAELPFSAQGPGFVLPATGRVLVYLDVFPEHVAPAEDPALVDPALAPVETSPRTRVGFRVRVATTTASSFAAAFTGLAVARQSTGRLTVSRTAPTTAPDPCDPPGDPLGLLPEGLFRVEVLDGGTAATARFVWSIENGAAAVAAGVAGSTATLAPSASVAYARGELVEVSWLERRADRADHGPLYAVTEVTVAGSGQVLTLDRAITVPAGATGVCVRRWDGQVAGASTAVAATVRGADLGLRFQAAAGSFLAGDWWGARLRSATPTGVEPRSAAPPDGIPHAVAPLALVDAAGPTVLEDCRPAFRPLTLVQRPVSACTVVVRPGDDLQQAVDALPASGGEVCLAAGRYRLAAPVTIRGRSRVVVQGVGPATVLAPDRSTTAVQFLDCTDVEVRHLRAEGSARDIEAGLTGALAFFGCTGVRVVDCDLSCADAPARAHSCLFVGAGPTGQSAPSRQVRLEGNRCQVGAGQVGILVADAEDCLITGNDVRFVATGSVRELLGLVRPGRATAPTLVADLTRSLAAGALAGTSRGGEPVTVADAFAARRDVVRRRMLRGRLRRAADPAPRALFRAFVAESLRPDRFAALDRPLQDALVVLLDRLRSGGQGIVVGGSRTTLVRITDNLVEGTVQGIHVGTSGPAAGREVAAEVLVSRNVVHLLVPVAFTRERHAIFIGNAGSVHVLDTTASVRRTGIVLPPQQPTPVDGIRIYGTLGPFLVVRNSALQGFGVGVRVVSVAPEPPARRRLWMVSETVKSGGAGPTVLAAAHPPGQPAPVLTLANNVP